MASNEQRPSAKTIQGNSMKPTPVQARGLRALNGTYEKSYQRPRIHLYEKHKPGEYYGISNEGFMNGHKIVLSTAKVLLKNGWIEKDEKGYGDYYISQSGIDILELLSNRDFKIKKTKKPIWTTRDIVDALNEKYRRLSEGGYTGAPKWIYFSELPNNRFASRRVDFWAMACWGSLDYKRVSFEIKITRGDFLHELKDPTKKEFAMEISNEFYFVTPPDLIKEDELPDDCGLIELSQDGRLITKVKATSRKPDFIFTWDFIACLGRKTYKKSIEIKKESV